MHEFELIKNYLESKDFKGKVICYVMDVSQERSITNVLEKLKKDNIRIDILINNAAINPKQSSLKNNKNLQ
jgi:short-subunit dehydrogenase